MNIIGVVQHCHCCVCWVCLMCFMCFIHMLHTCASCALYARGRIVGLLGLVSSSIDTETSDTRNGYMISRLDLSACINRFTKLAQRKIVSPAWVTIIIYILRSREREIRFHSIRRKVCVRECVYAREKQRERGRQRQRKSPASIQLGAFDKLLTDRQKDRRVEEQKKCSQLGQISKICIHAREGRRVPPL